MNSVLSAWAAVLDVHSLRDVAVPLWPKDVITLPPLSMLLASYQMAKRYHPFRNPNLLEDSLSNEMAHTSFNLSVGQKEEKGFPVKVVTHRTVVPLKAEWIMLKIDERFLILPFNLT